MYEFAWRTKKLQFGQILGACHALEIPFMFDTLYSDGDLQLTGTNPPQELADEMHATWAEFAKSGNPGWIHYDLTTRPVQTFDFDAAANKPSIVLVNDPRGEERRLWDGIVGP